MQAILQLLNAMSPYLLLGFLLAGLLHAFVPRGGFTRHLAAPSFVSVLKATLLGIPLPLCSCGVIPTAMSLRREGASRGAVAAFLIATPQTGLDSIFATYSLMGFPFALVRPLAALATALLGGALVNTLGGRAAAEAAPAPAAAASRDSSAAQAPQGFCAKLATALRYGFVEMMEDIGKWLVVGIVVAAVNDAVENGWMEYDRLVKFDKDSDGRVTALSSNMAEFNRLQTAVADDVLARLSQVSASELAVPLGTLTGSPLLAGRGPKLTVKMETIGTATAKFRDKFTAAGINQTKHQILLDVDVYVTILLPGITTYTKVSNEISVAETVIVGGVPQTYTYFSTTEDKIEDYADEYIMNNG